MFLEIFEKQNTDKYKLGRYIDSDKDGYCDLVDENDLEKSCWSALIGAADYRGIILYDSFSNGKMTLRLLEKMNWYISEECPQNKEPDRTITDLFIRKSNAISYNGRINIHLVEDNTWDVIEKHYFEYFKGTVPNGHKNLVLGIDKNKDNFIIGNLTVVKNKRNVLLGSY